MATPRRSKQPPKIKAKPSAKAAERKPNAKLRTEPSEFPILAFEDKQEFARWLAQHHASSRGIWLRLMKQVSGKPCVGYRAALSTALAWGWIDGQLKPFDDESWLRKFSPRGPRSTWSKINRDSAQALIEAGEMKPPGLAQVELAKQNGNWQAAYDSPKNAKVPPDLAAALKKSPRAAAFFATLEARNRYAVLYRVQAPKQAETRERKVREMIAMLERGEKIHR